MTHFSERFQKFDLGFFRQNLGSPTDRLIHYTMQDDGKMTRTKHIGDPRFVSHGKPLKLWIKKNFKYVKKHDIHNTELSINTCIIKLQTFNSNVQE